MKDEANRGAQPMHRNRRFSAAIALLSLVSLVAALAFGLLDTYSPENAIAQTGIEGEGDLPLPVS
jgi:hypothetical protein